MLALDAGHDDGRLRERGPIGRDRDRDVGGRDVSTLARVSPAVPMV
jgi:hypothetical protein